MKATAHNVTPPRGPRSIQGEERVALDTAVFMEQGEVDEYVTRVSDAIIECRERGRHLYPRTRPSEPIRFMDVTDDGLLVRELECTCCGCAVRVELWEAVRADALPAIGRLRITRRTARTMPVIAMPRRPATAA